MRSNFQFLGVTVWQFPCGKPFLAQRVYRPSEHSFTSAILKDGRFAYSNRRMFKYAYAEQLGQCFLDCADHMRKLGAITEATYNDFIKRADARKERRDRRDKADEVLRGLGDLKLTVPGNVRQQLKRIVDIGRQVDA